jgi:hypothetical protein
MKVDGVKITWIAPEEVLDQRERPGFRDVCQYGSMVPERNEIGSVAVDVGPPVPTSVPGIWSIPVRCKERIFIVEPA